MPVAGDDDTVASSLQTLDGSPTGVGPGAELVGGRYRIVRWLGGGGMGRVYEALDTELDERVALKVLLSGLSEEALERFRREVKLTRRIQHRNVARMFDIGEHRGERFLTMELVDGDPLTRRMTDKPMAWPELKALAEQICSGLAAAHAAGVVHRDLKPDNVLVERDSDRAVLTDFGIARSGDDVGVTQIGAIVGTPRYMAPEQLAGREVDARADLFSLGVMLFELATATRPWPGDNAISIAVSQATMPARTIDSESSSAPGYFASIVAACLQVEPDARPVSAAEIALAIAAERPAAITRDGAPPIAKPAPAPRAKIAAMSPRAPATPTLVEPATIAVLPLACAPADEYLADGLLEDVTDTLSATPGLRVRPAGIVRQAAAPDAREVGQRLQVDHVISGTVRRTPAGLRIATRLISVADGFQVWANRTDCTEAQVLTVADELARGIAEALSTRATSMTAPMDARAVDLYLRARAELRRFWGNHAQAAASLLDQAVKYAPTSAPLLAAAAYAHVQTWVMKADPTLFDAAREALERGLATGHGEAYLASAQFYFNRGDQERGAGDLARALARAPMSAQSHELTARIMLELEGPSAARPRFQMALGLDPGRAMLIENELARADAFEGKWSECQARLQRLLADPDPSIQRLGFVTSSRFTAWRGDKDTVRAALKRYIALASNIPLTQVVGGIDEAGKLEETAWKQVVTAEPGERLPVRQLLVRLQIVTEIALALDDLDKGMVTLERAVGMGLIDATWINHCPVLAKVADHERFAPLRREVTDRAARVLAAFRSVTSS